MVTAAPPILAVEPRELQRRIDHGEKPDMLDVRTPAEYAAEHAVGVKLMPLDKLVAKRHLEERGGPADAPVYIFCKSGTRALRAAEKFARIGFDHAVVVEGGTDAWARTGLPVERCARQTMSLERQVRLAVGVVVLVGTLLGAVANGWFLLVPALMGAGLIFAGLTDFCGLSMVLARCPWNR